MDDVEIDHGAVVRSLALYADALLVVEKLFVLLDAIQLLADVVAALDAAPTDRAVDHHPWDSHEPPGHVASTQPAAHAPPLRNAAPLSAGAAVAA
jgi:hypothetical protein